MPTAQETEDQLKSYGQTGAYTILGTGVFLLASTAVMIAAGVELVGADITSMGVAAQVLGSFSLILSVAFIGIGAALSVVIDAVDIVDDTVTPALKMYD